MTTRLTLIIATLITSFLLSACSRDADVASRNLSRAADMFEINRRVVFYNGITGDYMLTVEGLCALRHEKAVQMSEPLEVGTLVQCLHAPNPLHQKFVGTVHIVRKVMGETRVVAYLLDPPTVSFNGVFEIELVWTRQYLRVIDNPGDDATDETLLWKPVPTNEGVPA